MKTYTSLRPENSRKESHLTRWIFQSAAVLLMFFLSGCSTPSVAQKLNISVNFELPSWAPYYDRADQVRYYYFPDIECYYDVRNRDFIYMEDGEWMFGRSLPRIYGWFNLNDCFIVALDYRVVEPWRHFHYYVSHYPRYYYRTVYRDRYNDHERRLRGFNENERAVVFNKRYDGDERRDNGRIERNESRREDNSRFENRNENREENKVRREFPERRVVSTHPAEPVRYYGKEVGRPVRVQKNMKRSEEIKTRENKRYRER